ncbi:fimbria/pilus periplasmic chaperone [Enterobacter sp. 22325]|uniref:fimbria/pilus periplasmic chaperone n=1 Tax=Enterobacter sp. 22325 TaxID=3453911 RepID=UPI003F85FA3E
MKMTQSLLKVGMLLVGLIVWSAQGALTVDRSRMIFNEGERSISINVNNRNEKNPYLAQSWMEDTEERKISGPLIVLPPVQRVEAGGKTLVRIQALPEVAGLPKDRESVFYFNLREIPPKSNKNNILTLAMQSRLKVFYRPALLKVDPMADSVPGARDITLTKQGNLYQVNNPTPYYFSFVEIRSRPEENGLDGFEPVMVSPRGSVVLKPPATTFGNMPSLIFINDYGSQRLLPFSCSGNICKASDPVPVKPSGDSS